MPNLQIDIPDELYRRLEGRLLAGAGRGVEEVVLELLEELGRGASELDDAEENLLEKRLRELGYL